MKKQSFAIAAIGTALASSLCAQSLFDLAPDDGGKALWRIGEMFDHSSTLATLWLAFVSATAFSIWNHLSTIFPVTLLASYRFLIPICGVSEALVFLKTELAGWGLMIGGILVVTSMVLAKKNSSDRKN